MFASGRRPGDLVEVELIIESRNDYEALVVADPEAAGFEAHQVQSRHLRNSSLGAYMEPRDKDVILFVRRLPRGLHSLTCRLRAETPGKFSALPANVEAMYAPELVGNSDEMLAIQPGPRRSVGSKGLKKESPSNASSATRALN